ncbi:MAG: MFS transporter [Spirochaetaceae bacterium]|jgi:Na+/melibiose symporter-like transporter|nr:MFS transporter [Spirochaetaceae bacterium]
MSDKAAKTGEMTLEKKVPWLFFLNTLSQQFGINVTLLFMNMFLTNFVKITPLVVASILTIGRIVDMAVSFVAGGIVQKANLKTGPYRTWILLNGPFITLGVFLIFLNPNIGLTAKIVVVLIGYFFRNIPQNFLIAAQNTLIQKVGGANMTNRLAITAKNIQGIQTGAIIVSAVTVPLITTLNNVVGNGRGYLIVGVTFGLVQTLGQVILYINLKEYDKYDPHLKRVEGSSVNVRVTHIYGDTFRNPYIWLLIVGGVFTQVALFTLSPLSAYFFAYSLGNLNLMAVSRTVSSSLGLAVAFLAPFIVRRIGKRNSAMLSTFGAAVLYACIALLANGNFIIYIILTSAILMINGPVGSVGVNLWLDAAEYQLHKTGRDSRPFIMSINSITMKIGQMISSFTYAWVLSFAEFDTATSTLNAQKLVWGMYGLLAAFYLIIFTTYLLFNITESRAKELAAENHKMLEERRAAATAAGA